MTIKQSAPSSIWDIQWETIQSLKPSMVIIDPLTSAAPGVEMGDNTGARAFIQAVMKEAELGGFGVLVNAHSNKMARYNTSDPGPGAIAGPSQFYDAARGVLYCCRVDNALLMTCPKANNGPDKWGVLMERDWRQPTEYGKLRRFAGWLMKGDPLDREDVAEKLKARGRK